MSRYFISVPPMKVYKQVVVDGEALLVAHNEIPGGEYANAKEPVLLSLERAYSAAVGLVLEDAEKGADALNSTPKTG